MKLSKTNFIIALDCLKNAWLKIHKPEIYKQNPVSAFDKNIIETGNVIDVLARDLFPGGVHIEARDDVDGAARLMASRTPVIYQPVFSAGNYLFVADIIVWNPVTGVYDLYEVKSSTVSEEDGGRKTDDYLIDIAFQKNVLDDAGIAVGTLNLVRLSKEYIRKGALDPQKLFFIEDMTAQVQGICADIRQQMEGAYERLASELEPKGHCDCIVKGRNSHCTTAWYSNADLPEYSVHSIARIHKNKLSELVESGIFDIKDVPDYFELSDIQRRQVTTAQTNVEHIDRKGVADFLETLEFPLSFLDYETYPSALPRFDEYHPYQQIPFQFSLHVIESPAGEASHYDFITTDPTSPDASFASALQKHLPESGSVVVWNQKFEMGINTQIGERLPSVAAFMAQVNARVVDLMVPFYGKTSIYDHPEFRGSASIKYVLPALVPHLSYKHLHIQEGGAASDTWNRIVTGEYSKQEAGVKTKALKEYCHLDTLAMVEIWRVLALLRTSAQD
ncbi:MAG: DUF2779 domain-containing protein [Candidatus Pacebacteria bacterium]|nr:DUF2779 domain-containing protein [Candidatus Paceibacterota bacterium]